MTVADLAGLRDRVEKSFYDEILRKCGGDPTDSRVMPTHGFMDADFWRRYEAWTNMFCVVRRHRVFTVLDEHHSFPPFRIETYKKERGLVISSDGSHPHSIEVHETVPDSLSRMMFDRVMRTNELLEKIVDLLSTPRKEAPQATRSEVDRLISVQPIYVKLSWFCCECCCHRLE